MAPVGIAPWGPGCTPGEAVDEAPGCTPLEAPEIYEVFMKPSSQVASPILIALPGCTLHWIVDVEHWNIAPSAPVDTPHVALGEAH